MWNIWYPGNTQVYSKQKKWSWQKQKQKTDVEMICIFNKMKTVLPIESKIGST